MTSYIPFESLRNIPLSYASCSIGSKQSDTLPRKLEAIAAAGFTAIELSFPDIIAYGTQITGKELGIREYAQLVNVTREIKKLADSNGLQIMMLQPFGNFEGWPPGSRERDDAFRRVAGWMDIMDAAGTDLLQVGSSDSPAGRISIDRKIIVSDLRELCDLLAKRNMRLAYENWCWSTHAPTWKDVWEIVKAIDRPNAGLCLDTFQTSGGEYGDPTTEMGLINHMHPTALNQVFHASLDELARTVPPEKIYLLQISDAYKPPEPLAEKTVKGLRPRGRWSHDFRPMPYDGGYLPIEEVAKAVLRTGFRGWFSMEIFDGGPDGKGREYDMNEYAEKAMKSMQRFLSKCSTDRD
ncbi:sugar phosphate isomerase/epimerase family protein [Aspergillus chevalieri]|uniref:Xylose isomerase-like TIM barrel domain-containing protein n=1 Tax=Aspergillus chevalieri TaxID=182096 RepID=A0A7R7VYR9_ASPCH|nr:uncharacterized protein ACHE_80668A [Aspergillus chevalieri]BCR92768.1 hypothetical protein ACHE_80668A [Aspergillus chevalieri]